MSRFPCTSQCIIIHVVLWSLLSVKANHEITIQKLEIVVYFVFAQFSRHKTTAFPQTHSIQIQKYFWESVDTFSLNEKKMFYHRVKKEVLAFTLYQQISAAWTSIFWRVTPSPFIADEAEQNSDVEFGFGSVGLGLVVQTFKGRMGMFEKSYVGASTGCL